ncbi:uncharacterized protein LOC132293439 [Cornus florida]|uniref:uncharacterized protein LOC132293439 n=1 Tax=Cornus florida TaxID=4283 RepID=UPI00289BCB8D|nr:uncharacterized protein LOC132293439 [Cornus florida]
MKVSAKPISSPRRAEKFPPPLMRFLRSNVGSRSRGRSRTSPMFVRKKNNNAVIETQEPSSPKVTCIGQVRVRRSSKQKSGSKSGRTRTPPAKRRRCWCVRKTSFCHYFVRKIKPRSFRPDWSKWVFIFRFGYCRKTKTKEDFSTVKSNQESRYRGNTATDTRYEEDEDEDGDGDGDGEAPDIFVTHTPPKNALLLTRCRSAPYRSSSLASQFWGSPLLTSETVGDEEKKAPEQQEDREQERPTSEDEPDCRDSTAESRTDRENDGNLGILEEFEGSTEEETKESIDVQRSSTSIGPMMLTRCKSEPARTGERLNPEPNSWTHTRSKCL